VKLWDRGEADAACDAFEASYLADQAVNALVRLADCRMAQGKLATAWAWYVRLDPLAARRSGQT